MADSAPVESRQVKLNLALHGGRPVRQTMLPYGRQLVDEDDVAAVSATLRSDWLTTGPKVDEFEHALAGVAGVAETVAVSSGTAGLHAAMHALGVGAGDEVIVSTMTFAATANAVVYMGARPIFADVDRRTLLVDPGDVERKITPRTRAIVAVDYAGQPAPYDALRPLADRAGVALVADGCHALGARDSGRPVGSLADLTVFSFHPVKQITTAEGGAVATRRTDLAARMRVFRNHGITTNHREREAHGSWFYEMTDLGYNYRLSDLQCALGLSQLRKLPRWLEARRAIAASYDTALVDVTCLASLAVRPGVTHAYHLYVVSLDLARWQADRATVFAALRREGIGVNVHYIPVHLHPYYRRRFETGPGLCPVAEAAYDGLLSLPIFPGMTDRDTDDVIAAVHKVAEAYAG